MFSQIALSSEVFWRQIGNFNTIFHLLHLVWITVSLVLVAIVFIKPGKVADILLKSFLAASFIFNGVVFFELYSTHPVSRGFYGPLFIVVGLLLLIDLFRRRLSFRLPEQKWLRRVTFLWLVLVYTYPLFGLLLGRNYPFLCMPMNGCPLTTFAIAMVTAAFPRIDRKVLIALIPWGLLGLPKAFGVFGCYEDAILFLAGVYGLVMLAKYWRVTGMPKSDILSAVNMTN